LAFNSRSYFENRTNSYVHPPLGGIENEPVLMTRAEWRLQENAVSPERIRYYSHPDPRPDSTSSPKLSQWLLAQFDWLESTNVGGILMPTSTTYEEFVSWRDANLGPQLRVQVNVTEIEEADRLTAFQPEITDSVQVSDRRFALLNPPIELVSYVVDKGQWRGTDHPQLQQLYANALRPYREVPPFLIRIFFWFTAVAIGLAIGVKSWQIANGRVIKTVTVEHKGKL
jgi:hypothetical protein